MIAARRGAFLLEALLALAIFVAMGIALVRITDRSATAAAGSAASMRAFDVARSGMALLESGAATPETLGDVLGSLGADGGFEVDVRTSPGATAGVVDVVVEVRARVSGDGATASRLEQAIVLPRGIVEAAR